MVFDNIKNIIFVFSKNYSYFFNLVIFVFFMFFRTKKKPMASLVPILKIVLENCI